MNLTRDELELCRQWFDAVQDVNPEYLQPSDFVLAKKIHELLGMRVPHSIAPPASPG